MSTLKVNSIQDTGGNNGVTPGEINKGIIKIYCDWKTTSGHSINNSNNVSSITMVELVILLLILVLL